MKISVSILFRSTAGLTFFVILRIFRIRMLQSKLNELILLNVNYDEEVKPEELFERFSKIGKHPSNFIVKEDFHIY